MYICKMFCSFWIKGAVKGLRSMLFDPRHLREMCSTPEINVCYVIYFSKREAENCFCEKLSTAALVTSEKDTE